MWKSTFADNLVEKFKLCRDTFDDTAREEPKHMWRSRERNACTAQIEVSQLSCIDSRVYFPYFKLSTGAVGKMILRSQLIPLGCNLRMVLSLPLSFRIG